MNTYATFNTIGSSRTEYPQELAHILHCNFCAETFSDMMLLNVHIKQHHVAQERTSDNCTCYICDKAYGSFGVLYSHIQQHHNTTAVAQIRLLQEYVICVIIHCWALKT